MNLPSYISFKASIIFFTILTLISFFALLISMNYFNRSGIKEAAQYELEIADKKDKIEKLNQSMATYSSLIRVEQRAKELGFEKVTHVEYIK